MYKNRAENEFKIINFSCAIAIIILFLLKGERKLCKEEILTLNFEFRFADAALKMSHHSAINGEWGHT